MPGLNRGGNETGTPAITNRTLFQTLLLVHEIWTYRTYFYMYMYILLALSPDFGDFRFLFFFFFKGKYSSLDIVRIFIYSLCSLYFCILKFPINARIRNLIIKFAVWREECIVCYTSTFYSDVKWNKYEGYRNRYKYRNSPVAFFRSTCPSYIEHKWNQTFPFLFQNTSNFSWYRLSFVI